MPKKYLHTKQVKTPIYGGYFRIVLCNSAKKLRKFMPNFPHHHEVYAHAYQNGWVSEEDKKGKFSKFQYIIMLNTDASLPLCHSSITHECVHLGNFLAQHVGFIDDYNNDEPMAYLCGWFADQIYDFMSEHNKMPKVRANVE